MYYRRADTYREYGEIDACEVRSQREQDYPDQREGGRYLQAALEGTPVEHHADERLEYRRCNLVDEGDRAYLREAQPEVVLYYRIRRGDRGLQQVVEEMCYAQRHEHRYRRCGNLLALCIHRGAKILKNPGRKTVSLQSGYIWIRYYGKRRRNHFVPTRQ